MDANCISYKETGYFSQTVIDYLDNQPDLRSFYSYRPDLKGFAELLENKKVTANRDVLVQVLTEQYNTIKAVDASAVIPSEAINLLGSENTYTITTGHQLNIFTGPLYFIYKIVTAIKLCRTLKDAFPDKNFIPVYWMASEDHDFPEINYTNIGGKKVQWQFDAAGATGRLATKSIRDALNQYKGVLGLSGYATELSELVETAYCKFEKLADATRYLVNALFSRYGLAIIDADDARLKRIFAPVMAQDIIEQNSFKNISATNELLQKLHAHIQVNPREINFFYLTDNLRERIVLEKGRYCVLNTDISFSAEELYQEIEDHPERFSPNVVMRPLYQEYILPNLAYIGGGGELVYWLELKSNFDYYQVNFPILILRNSALVMRRETTSKFAKLDFSPACLFKGAEELKAAWVKRHSQHHLSLEQEREELQSIFERLKHRSYKIDPTLADSTEAVQSRLKHAIDRLEKKLIRAEKRNYATRLEQIDHIKNELFPKNSLQERTENFGLLYVKWGRTFIDELIRNFNPLDFKFTILAE
jgi:bacillithiol biosynthesis cysteine-adding enzyme BshC